MSQGIKDYCRYVIKNIGTAGTAYVNLNQQNKNLHLIISLMNQAGHYQ